ncbi:MAG: phosphodiesterase [Acidaminococcus sp.]|jgi:putative phosphoesterase|nr:phosphodiesterase [Acidaminococcus sp.]MCI2100261.1 phosphodiesterase [Acidaminococcus sp.]MCI2114581.1 phosphodiesterase [Acidaminococcus sp.]MCI2116558.1 phosphodiesterase [Acidaminococcus sp.]
MKLLIASDIHGSAMYCRQLAEAITREKADKLLLLGDILYHGARNELPAEYAPKVCTSLLNGLSVPVYAVRGNCDSEVDQMVLHFSIMAEYGLIFWGGRTLFITHGHHYNLAALPPLAPGDILLHGHTHVPAWKAFGTDNYYLNPGSVTMPKENSERGYMVLEGSCVQWKKLDGTIYHELTL